MGMPDWWNRQRMPETHEWATALQAPSNGCAHYAPLRTEYFLGMAAIIASEAMRQLMGRVEQVARTDAAVLLTGESGSGKEVVARAIHHYSLRCAQPWVDVSCAALPDHLLESELFGYEKGAFSGADSRKQGLFELADRGSLFLDEIGELEPRMQVKLLRVLDGTPFYRLGGTKKVQVDARIIAATNSDLDRAIAEGRFRRDLYHRLNHVHFTIPPLRQRRDDIVPLAGYFLSQQNANLRFSEDALEALRAYGWPGNVRELRNLVTGCAALASGAVIDAADLNLPLPQAGREARCAAGTVEDMERRMILEALSQTRGHHQKAADLLGISRRTLHRKLKIYEQESASAGSAQ
jgi:two-component system, NtrC family, response regulator AtoC